MNRIINAVLLMSLVMPGIGARADAEIHGGIGISGGGRGMRTSVMIRMQNRSVPHSSVGPTAIVRDRAQVSYPSTFGNGSRITARAAVSPPSQHTAIVRNTGVIRSIQSSQRVEIVPNRYYWHNAGGVRYCHFFNGGIHWYGFYNGPSFYWTRFYSGFWWWFDVNFDRWVYWQDGYWCWPGPDGVVYDYVDNNYYPADEQGNVTVKTPEVLAPPKEVPKASTATEAKSWKSPDGKRMVQLSGANSEAFLYDNSAAQPIYLKYLGKDVENVRFAGGNEGKPVRILIDFKNGSFAMTSENGDPLDQ